MINPYFEPQDLGQFPSQQEVTKAESFNGNRRRQNKMSHIFKIIMGKIMFDLKSYLYLNHHLNKSVE